MLDSVITLHSLYCNMASKRNFLAKFPGITTVLNLGILADYMRTLGLPGRDNINKEKGWVDQGWSHLTHNREKKRVVLKNIMNRPVSQN